MFYIVFSFFFLNISLPFVTLHITGRCFFYAVAHCEDLLNSAHLAVCLLDLIQEEIKTLLYSTLPSFFFFFTSNSDTGAYLRNWENSRFLRSNF